MATKKQLTTEQNLLLQALYNRAVLTVRFIESVEEFQNAPQLLNILESAVTKGDIRSLRLMNREIDAMTMGLPSHQREGLEALLKQKLGVDKDAERAMVTQEVARILKRGTIASEKERRRLQEYAEMLEVLERDKKEIEQVNSLLRNS